MGAGVAAADGLTPRDLFAPAEGEVARYGLAPGAVLLRGFACASAPELERAIAAVSAAAPFRHMVTPGGFTMSVAMTNCGDLGWVSSDAGYRYAPHDPDSGSPWPPLSPVIRELATSAAAAAGYPGFLPDACLINRYDPGARLTLHQDKDEHDFTQPIVSVSLGVPATFLFGGLKRKERVARIAVEHGDVVVWGGPSRLRYHGVAPLKQARHPFADHARINLTLRRAS